MKDTNFHTAIEVNATPEEVFDAINNVRGWWSEEIEGSTHETGDEFTYHYKDVHRCKLKVIESIAGRKVAWQIIDNYFKFTNNKSEWTGNTIVFEITKRNNKTKLAFTQLGLVPQYECYEICRDAWTNYINNSLRSLISTGNGMSAKKENEFDEQLLRQHNK